MITTIETLRLSRVVGEGHTQAVLALHKRNDGSYEFTTSNGNQVRAMSNEDMRKLFEALAALA